MADIAARQSAIASTRDGRSSLHKLMQRKSTVAFFMALPLILLILILVAYPAGYAVWLSTLNKSMTKFVGLGNFDFLFKRATFWEVVLQSCLFAITGGDLQGVHRLRGGALRQQHPDQGPAQVARHAAGAVGHPGGDEHAQLAVAVRPLLLGVQLDLHPARASARSRGWARRAGRASRSSWSTSGSARRSS
jgi:hypothetical protein